jgi:hypothetical protein
MPTFQGGSGVSRIIEAVLISVALLVIASGVLAGFTLYISIWRLCGFREQSPLLVDILSLTTSMGTLLIIAVGIYGGRLARKTPKI